MYTFFGALCHSIWEPWLNWTLWEFHLSLPRLYNFLPELIPAKWMLGIVSFQNNKRIKLTKAWDGSTKIWPLSSSTAWVEFEAAWKVTDVVYNFLSEFVPAKIMLASKLTRELNLQIPRMCQKIFGYCCQQQDLKAVWSVADVVYLPMWLADIIISLWGIFESSKK